MRQTAGPCSTSPRPWRLTDPAAPRESRHPCWRWKLSSLNEGLTGQGPQPDDGSPATRSPPPAMRCNCRYLSLWRARATVSTYRQLPARASSAAGHDDSGAHEKRARPTPRAPCPMVASHHHPLQSEEGLSYRQADSQAASPCTPPGVKRQPDTDPQCDSRKLT